MTQADSVVIGGTVPLDISGVAVSGITAGGATITWTTNGGATSQILYDTVSHSDANYPNSTTPIPTRSPTTARQ